MPLQDPSFSLGGSWGSDGRSSSLRLFGAGYLRLYFGGLSTSLFWAVVRVFVFLVYLALGYLPFCLGYVRLFSVGLDMNQKTNSNQQLTLKNAYEHWKNNNSL